MKRAPWASAKVVESPDHLIHPAHGIPNPIHEFGGLEQGVGGWGIEGAEAQVHVLKGESGAQLRRLEEVPRATIVLDKGLELKQQRQLSRTEILAEAVELTADEFVERHSIVQPSFRQVTHQTGKAAWLDGFQFGLELAHIGCQRKCLPIGEVDLIGGVDPDQIQMIIDIGAQGGIRLAKHIRHEQEGRPRVETVPIDRQLIGPPSWMAVPFQYCHGEPCPRQAAGSDDPP